MYYYFLKEYEEKVYKGFHRKLYELKPIEIVLIIAMIVLACITVISLLFRLEIISIVSFSILLVLLLGMIRFYDKDMKNNRELFTQNHIEKHIQPLIRQLKFNKLYTKAGIDWLIDCCEKDIENHKNNILISRVSKLFMSVIYPMFNLILGLILKDSTLQDNIWFLAWLIIIFLMGCGFLFIIQPLAQYFKFPEKDIVEYLKNDLKYIKSQM